MQPLRFVPNELYYDELLHQIPHAKKRIVLAAMLVFVDDKTQAVFQLISDALRRGVRVHIFLDVYSFSFAARNKHLSSAAHRVITVRTKQMLAQLQTQGARITLFGNIGLNPFKGRCHIKITVIDDLVYSFGGVNFTQDSFSHTDYMMSLARASVADVLEDLVGGIPQAGSPKDKIFSINAHNSILFDSGQPGRSVIYERACELAANAKQVYAVSQMVPSGRLAQLIRQIRNQCYFNRPAQASLHTATSIVVDQAMGRINNLYRRPEYIHAKFMLFEMNNGSKALVSGSNNFSWRGVAYGTKEIALYSTDVALWRQLYNFMKQRIA